MSDNDPFGLGGGDAGGGPKTVVVPNPGGMLGGAPPSGAFGGGMSTGLGAADAAAARPGINPLVDAAAPLLELVIYLSRQIEPMKLGELRSRILALMGKFTDEAQRAGQHRQIVEMARYALSATLDDVIMSRPWGDLTLEWGANTLGSQLESEVYAGDKFFTNLDMCLNEPRAKDLLELKYICLSLGFKGRYRNPSEAGRVGELDQFRSRAYQQLVAWRGGLGEVVADHWAGEEAPRKPFRDLIPLWLVGAVSVGLAALVFVLGYTFSGQAGAMAVASVPSAMRAPARSTAAASPRTSLAGWIRATPPTSMAPSAPGIRARARVSSRPIMRISASVTPQWRRWRVSASARAIWAGLVATSISSVRRMSASMPSAPATRITSSTVPAMARTNARTPAWSPPDR